MVKTEDPPPLLETASEVCGLSKKHQWKRETWWWDDKVEEAVKFGKGRGLAGQVCG